MAVMQCHVTDGLSMWGIFVIKWKSRAKYHPSPFLVRGSPDSASPLRTFETPSVTEATALREKRERDGGGEDRTLAGADLFLHDFASHSLPSLRDSPVSPLFLVLSFHLDWILVSEKMIENFEFLVFISLSYVEFRMLVVENLKEFVGDLLSIYW